MGDYLKKLFIDEAKPALDRHSGGADKAIVNAGWQGTVVPNSGYVENVYFNTNLSVEEVVAICETLTLNDEGTNGEIILGCQNSFIVIAKLDGVWVIADLLKNVFFFSTSVLPDYGIDFIGWNPNLTMPYVINSEVVDSEPSGDIDVPIGTQNHLITSLFSTTPFTQESATLSGEYDGSTLTITELPKGDWQGTAVPNEGTVENVYLNISLSNEEILNLMPNLTYDEDGFYVAIIDSEQTMMICIVNNMGIADFYAVQQGDFTKAYWVSPYAGEESINAFGFSGWNPNFNGVVEVNKTVISSMGVNSAGTENDKLTSLFSTTPFTYNEPNTIDIKTMIENDKHIPLKVNLDLPTSGGESTLKKLLDYTKSTAHMFESNTTITDLTDYITYDDTENVNNMAYMFDGCSSLITMPQLNTSKLDTIVGMFDGCSSLTTVSQLDTSNVSGINNLYTDCYSLTSIPQITATKCTLWSAAFKNCYKLEKIDIKKFTSSSSSSTRDMFTNCYSLKTLIMREITANNTLHSSTFTNCYHLTGTVNETYNPNGDKDCYIYVPSSMVDTLKAKTIWSTYADQIRALEDYTVDGTTTGELDESKI